MAMRPIYHQIEPRVKAHIFVAALALLVQRLLGRRLKEAGVDLSPARAMEALSTVRLVIFRLEGQPERRGVTGGGPHAPLVWNALNRPAPKAPRQRPNPHARARIGGRSLLRRRCPALLARQQPPRSHPRGRPLPTTPRTDPSQWPPHRHRTRPRPAAPPPPHRRRRGPLMF